MTVLFDVILPVFLIIGFGYLAAWKRIFSDNAVEGVMTYAQSFAVPTLLFVSIARLDLAESERISPQEREMEYIMLRLRTARGIDIREFTLSSLRDQIAKSNTIRLSTATTTDVISLGTPDRSMMLIGRLSLGKRNTRAMNSLIVSATIMPLNMNP